MGIISTLLTGGSLLGKVCQMISESGVVHTVQGSDGSAFMVRAARMEINGVIFSEVVVDNKAMLNAYNPDPDMYVCVTYPNGFGNTEGFQTFIEPRGDVNLELGEWNTLSPDLPIYVQRLNLNDEAQIDNNRVIVAFKGLKLNGETLAMPNTHITATITGFQISFATASLGNLALCELRSESGIKATLREPVVSVNEKDPGTTSYKLVFSDLGFTENDILSGIMQFNISNKAAKLIKEYAKTVSSSPENALCKEVAAFMSENMILAGK